MVRRLLLIATPVLLCPGRPRRLQQRQRAVTVYSGRSEDLIGPLLEQFAEETGTDIEVRYGDSTELALLIAEEGDASPADVFISQSPGAVGFLDAEGLLGRAPTEALDRSAEATRPPTAAGSGSRAGVRVLVYNRTWSTRPTCPTRSST